MAVVDNIVDLKNLEGEDLGRTEWIEITQERVDTFADATNDHQWIHVDSDRAEESPFGGLVAHGFLTLSLMIPLFKELITIEAKHAVNYGMNKVRFPSPVLVGSQIRLHGAMESVREVKGGGMESTLNLSIEVQGQEKVACIAQTVFRHYF